MGSRSWTPHMSGQRGLRAARGALHSPQNMGTCCCPLPQLSQGPCVAGGWGERSGRGAEPPGAPGAPNPPWPCAMQGGEGRRVGASGDDGGMWGRELGRGAKAAAVGAA